MKERGLRSSCVRGGCWGCTHVNDEGGPSCQSTQGNSSLVSTLHRRRSVLVRTTAEGEVLETVRILNDVDRLTSVIARAGESPEVVLEATYGWVRREGA